METIFYIFLALLGLNLLVFIHELGHYIVARREGMKVEVFSIGFGKPIFSWMLKGVKWQICPIFVGGYVKIAGMEKEGDLEPYDIPEGFYSKKPWARIKVALAGPVINLVFAFLIFAAIWAFGGREKPFAEFTRLIGWIDPDSEFYEKGVRSGDEITAYNGEPLEGYKDLIYAAMRNGRPASIEGNKIDYYKEIKIPYDYTVKPYAAPHMPKGFTTIGVMSPASYLIYDEFAGQEVLYHQIPMANSGIEKHDRLVWVNGEIVFSQDQLSHILNDKRVLVTVERGNETFLAKISSIPMRDLHIQPEESAELKDWGYEIGMCKQNDMVFIPYFLSNGLAVEKEASYIDENSHVARVSETEMNSSAHMLLHPGDRIIAVNGIPVHSGPEFLKEMQARKVLIIVKRNSELSPISWKKQDHIFETGTDWSALLPIVASIGTEKVIKQSGAFYLLSPVTPVAMKDFPFTPEKKSEIAKSLGSQYKEIEKIKNPEQRQAALAALNQSLSRLMLGIRLEDRPVIYNPSPFALFSNVFQEITRNLVAVFSGYFSPKHFGGPLFIVQVMKESFAIGFKEALFWLGAISLNLGILNLLPIPVLDGGHICFSIIEKVRGKPLKAKTMQRLIIPFVALLIFFFIYLTYNDIMRMFGRFF